MPRTKRRRKAKALALPAARKEVALPSIDEATAKLKPFFEANPSSTIVARADGGLRLLRPWNDPSLGLDIDHGDDFDSLAVALNAVTLPERFTALWHRDERKLEVIWTSLKLPESQKELEKRKFEFQHRGIVHECAYGTSSEQLVTIASYALPLTISDTNYRNLMSFMAYSERADDEERFDYPKSFWIDNIDYDEAAVVDLAQHLNFYMQYYDGMSPTVVVNPRINERVVPKRTRYIKGKFPSTMESRVLDENLLSFWSFADSGNAMLRFLLYYRILEYAASHNVSDEVRETLKKVLLAPDLRGNLDTAIGSITSAVTPVVKLADSQRLRALFRRIIDPSLMWRDLKANREFFMKDTEFDGGFTVRAPIGKNDTDSTFDWKGLEQLADRFREIRNALSHGKDLETAGVIRPTPDNVEKFRPWVHLIATAAGEVVLYQEST